MPAARGPCPAARAHLILVRHGESDLGRAKCYAGHRDTPMSPHGRAQISRLRPRFEKLGTEIVVSSDLSRCLETARLLAPGARILETSRLRELDFGDWDGRSARDCRRRDADRFDRWMRNPWSTRTPRGENLRELWTRVRRFTDSIVRRFPNRTLAFITHAGPIRALLAPDPSRFWSRTVPPGALFGVDWDVSGPRVLPGEGRRRKG